jgi:hypothetical protein
MWSLMQGMDIFNYFSSTVVAVTWQLRGSCEAFARQLLGSC